MTHKQLPDDIQALVAGYVLGDLNAEERHQFQQLLTDDPEIVEEVADLQEALALLPDGLPPQRPDIAVRSRLLQAAQQQLQTVPTHQNSVPQPPPPTQHRPLLQQPFPQPDQRLSAPSWRSQLAGVMAIVLGGCSVFLAHRVVTLQTRLAEAEQAVALTTARQTDALDSSALSIWPADALLTQQWSGLAQIIQDHAGSVGRSQGPVDIAASDPMAVRDQLRQTQTSSDPVVSQLPMLPLPEAKLLGGSPCQFDQAAGLRMTYALPDQPLLSLYQIDLNGDQFPVFSETYITVHHDNINLVLWRQDDYLYALAAELPMDNLQRLTHRVKLI